MTLIDKIKADREWGSNGPFFADSDTDWCLDTSGENSCYYINSADGPWAVVAVESAFGEDNRNDADMRRVCRIPDMEAALLAAEELARLVVAQSSMSNLGEIDAALAAYRKAVGDT